MQFSKQALVFTCHQHKSFENTVGNEEIAHHEQFLLFPESVFYPFYHSDDLKLSSANSVGLEEPKICRLGKG